MNKQTWFILNSHNVNYNRSASKYVFTLLFQLILQLWPLLGQNNKIAFSNISVNDGLSDNSIKCIYKDSNGFIWFGTNSGLNRYDGYNAEIFLFKASDSTTITDNSITAISGDENGNLWVGTRTGISILDHETYKFRRFVLHSDSRYQCQDINYITTIVAGGQYIIAGTHNGMFIVNATTMVSSHLLFEKNSCSSPLNNITSITYDINGWFWIGTLNGSIYKFRPESGSVEKISSFKEESVQSGGILNLFCDNLNNLWVANHAGIQFLQISSGIWNTAFYEKYGKSFSSMLISGISQDSNGRIWITTDGNGAFIIEDSDSAPYNITSLPYSEGSLSTNGLTALYCDKSGIVWVGTSRKGVDFYKKNIKKFRLFRNYPNDPNSLSNNDVNCILEDSRGNIWIGTNGNGLDCYNRETNTFRHYTAGKNNDKSLSSNIVVSLFEDYEKKLWIGTYFGGLNCLDPSTDKISVFRFNESDSSSISDDRIWNICEDSKKNLWIATLTNGLNLYDRKTCTFIRLNSHNSALCFDYLNHITVDRNDNLWLSSANGLIFFDPENNKSECWYSNPLSTSSLSDNHVISTYFDSRGLFWICTNDGLNLMDLKNRTFRVFKVSDGLPSNSISRIVEDKNSDLWISSRNGISRLRIQGNLNSDSLKFNFTNYGINDGLQGKEFSEIAGCISKDGEIWFAGAEGINVFYPAEILKDSIASNIVLNGFRIDNIPVHSGEIINKRVLFEKPIFNTEKVILKYSENSFTIDFASLNFFNPERNRYIYNMEGLSDKWIVTGGKENYAAFSNVDNGTYTFRVKGTNSDGVWNQIPAVLIIKVLPPFWKSIYAYIIYVILIVSLLVFLRKMILARERLNTKIHQEQIEFQHLREIDSLKIKLFTNMSHELRTPLSLILSPAEKLKSIWKDKPEEKSINTIMQNSRRLLFMVNQLLDFRKMEVQGFGFNPSVGDIIHFLKDTVGSFEDLAEQKNIILSFDSEVPKLITVFDMVKLEKVVFNLLSNSFKFTHAGGRVSVAVKIEEADILKNNGNDSVLCIIVEDTGIGVPADKINKLFTSFYQVDQGFTADLGSGIGLSLAQEFIKLHDGDITVKSEQGKGSSFIIRLPVKKDIRDLHEKTPADEDQALSSLNDDASNLKAGKSAILIAEDDDDLRFYLKDNLELHYTVYEAENGEEALSLVKKLGPSLVISDIVMPGISGIELCRMIKADKRTSLIPVILLTGRNSEEIQKESFDSGADDYIPKPFNFQLLEARIGNLIATRNNLRKTFRNSIDIEPQDISITSLDEQFIQKTLDLVEKNMANTNYTVEELSRELGLSRTLLYKKLLSLTGRPPHAFIRSLRLKRAAQLLEKSQLNVSEVAFKVGFNDPKYFRKHFKNEFGVLPSQYFEKSRNKDQQTT